MRLRRAGLVPRGPAVVADPAKAEGQRAAPRAAAVLRLARTVAVAVAATYTGAVLGFAADAADHLDEKVVRKPGLAPAKSVGNPAAPRRVAQLRARLV